MKELTEKDERLERALKEFERWEKADLPKKEALLRKWISLLAGYGFTELRGDDHFKLTNKTRNFAESYARKALEERENVFDTIAIGLQKEILMESKLSLDVEEDTQLLMVAQSLTRIFLKEVLDVYELVREKEL